MKIGIVSLGCDKNRVDTENMLSYLGKGGHSFTAEFSDAEIIIVNTCAFIESAKKEAISTIFEMAEYKKENCKLLIVTGCLPQRYMHELKDSFTEVDIFLGTANYQKINEVIIKYFNENGVKIALENDRDARNFTNDRILTTPYHYAYLKIAEGCDNKCTYCAIPNIRGKYSSKPMDSLIDEAKMLIGNYGVKEINLVAQDITRYGIDIYNKYELLTLIEKLSSLDVSWIRLLYCYPELMTDELINMVATNDKVCKYLDIPLQHFSDNVLKRMNRRISSDRIIELVNKIRNANKGIEIRSSFIVGFPGESEEDFNLLKNFISKYKLDKCGFFTYSKEEGTPAEKLTGHLTQKIKNTRQRELYSIQHENMTEKAVSKIGTKLKVIYEGIDYDKGMFVARSQFEAPEVDNKIYFKANEAVNIGDFYDIEIIGNDNIDLIGELK